MISVDEAWKLIEGHLEPVGRESVPLRASVGRTVAADIRAPLDLPPFDNSAMDGYAIVASDTSVATAERPAEIPVVGESAAGTSDPGSVEPGRCARVMTGAPLPAGSDAVLQLEHGRLRHGVVEVRAAVPEGRHIRRRGEDVFRGDLLCPAGTVIGPNQVALLAESGVAEIDAHRRPRVALIATGSELAEPGAPLPEGWIYDANRPVLTALVSPLAELTDLGIAHDDPDTIRERVGRALDGGAAGQADAILISGGVSVGRHDHVKPVLADLGMERIFWRVRMKPGKPLLCGRIGRTWVFGLPGNPISAVVGYLVFAEPLLRRLAGRRDARPRFSRARLASPARKRDDRRTFLTSRIWIDGDGRLTAEPTRKQGSAMLHSLAASDGFVVVPEERSEIAAGETVDVLLPPFGLASVLSAGRQRARSAPEPRSA